MIPKDGLGRELGFGTEYGAVVGYSVFEASLAGGFAYFLIGLFFAFWSWVGVEMAPNYGEESRDPKRIVPRALYISVIGLGISTP